MAYRVRLLPRAAQDIQQIYLKVVQQAPVEGQKWYNRLIESLYSLDTFPERCTAVESLSRPGSLVRKLLYGRKGGVCHFWGGDGRRPTWRAL